MLSTMPGPRSNHTTFIDSSFPVPRSPFLVLVPGSCGTGNEERGTGNGERRLSLQYAFNFHKVVIAVPDGVILQHELARDRRL